MTFWFYIPIYTAGMGDTKVSPASIFCSLHWSKVILMREAFLQNTPPLFFWDGERPNLVDTLMVWKEKPRKAEVPVLSPFLLSTMMKQLHLKMLPEYKAFLPTGANGDGRELTWDCEGVEVGEGSLSQFVPSLVTVGIDPAAHKERKMLTFLPSWIEVGYV